MRRLLPLLVLALLAACSTPGLRSLKVGMTEAEIVQAWGSPNARHTVPGGARLEYATGPEGLETWMVDLDAAGRAVQWRQVLAYDHLRAVQGRLAGLSVQELQAEIGRPGHKRPDRLGGEVWSWRHESPFCLWFQASINLSGRVGSASFAPDPRCEYHDGQ